MFSQSFAREAKTGKIDLRSRDDVRVNEQQHLIPVIDPIHIHPTVEEMSELLG